MTIRLDEETKRLLQECAASLGVSTSSLVVANIKEMLRNGEARYMLPQNLRSVRSEADMRRERLKAYLEATRSTWDYQE